MGSSEITYHLGQGDKLAVGPARLDDMSVDSGAFHRQVRCHCESAPYVHLEDSFLTRIGRMNQETGNRVRLGHGGTYKTNGPACGNRVLYLYSDSIQPYKSDIRPTETLRCLPMCVTLSNDEREARIVSSSSRMRCRCFCLRRLRRDLRVSNGCQKRQDHVL